jgi:hypothetical protein
MSKARDLAGIFNLGARSGTTAQRPSTAEVGDIFYNGTTGKTEIYTTTGWKEMASGIPFGNTAGRPAAVTGQPYFNGETNRLELYTAGSGWQNIVQEVPGVASITGNYSEATNSGTITIAGTNFVSGAIASAIGTNGVEVIASSTTYNSLVQLTAVFTNLSNANEPYDIKVTNPSNLFGMIPDALYVNASPVWQTASGSLGTFNELISISVSATATDSDSTITYALASGSTLPSGVTLNSASGLISGTMPEVTSNTTYNFTINATDGLNVISRSFSITAVNATQPVDYLVVAGGGGGGTDQGGGGGAGGVILGNSQLLLGTLYNIVVGQGGVGVAGALRGTSGGNSTAFNLVAIGGGGGGGLGSGQNNGASGGSGGGGAGRWSNGSEGAAGAGTAGQGNSGARGSNPNSSSAGGGGGGAGGAGQLPQDLAQGNGGDGGAGILSSITGTSLYYAGGGGGGVYGGGSTSVTSGNGGSSVGGRGLGPGSTAPSDYTQYNGVANTGSGGGGGFGNSSVAGGNGSAGVVIVAYPNTYPAATVTGSYTQPTRSGYRVYRFTGNGSITF